MLPVQSVTHAIEELRVARNKLGFKAAFLRPHMYKRRVIHSPEWDPFWAEAQDLDCPISLHGGGAWPTPQAGADRFVGDPRGSAHVVIHPFEQQLACVGLIQSGVFKRFPKLRVAFLESGGGWVVPLFERLERHYDQAYFNEATRTFLRPWEYFRQNCWISFEPVERSLGLVADYIGAQNILWATDYPHVDGFFPGAPSMVEKCLVGCPDATRLAVLGGGARKFYGL
jgi:predicted TIM-barrel fold metal-dependent hydrolase